MNTNMLQGELGTINDWGYAVLTPQDRKSFDDIKMDIITFIVDGKIDFTKGLDIVENDVNLHIAQIYYEGVMKKYVVTSKKLRNNTDYDIILCVKFRNELYRDKDFSCAIYMTSNYYDGLSCEWVNYA